MPDVRSFVELNAQIGKLEDQLFDHQCALLQGRIGEAIRIYDEFRSTFAQRVWMEERYFFPLYQNGVDAEAPDGLITALHEKHVTITALLQRVHRAIGALLEASDEERGSYRQNLIRLESELHKRLADMREQKQRHFFPAMDGRTPIDQRALLIEAWLELSSR